jgi:flagellar biosynthesis/type III secretory pathway protein FliH
MKSSMLSGLRSRQLQQQNMQDKSDEQDALEEAFEKGYRLGRSDGREGVFIDVPSLVSQYSDSSGGNIKPDE